MELNKEKIKIRKCQKDDYWFCYYLLKRNMFDYIEKHQGGWNAKRHRENFHGKDVAIVGYGCKRIGFYHVEKRKKKLILIDMQVASKYQGRGLGTYLFSKMEK